MRSFRLGVVGTILAIFLGGCDGGTAVETTMPTTPPTTPPEIEQMKKEIEKNRQAQHLAATRPTWSNRRR